MLMEFTTVGGNSYGPPRKVTIGSVVVGEKLVAVMCGPSREGGVDGVEAEAVHEGPFFLDPDTEYRVPSSIVFTFKGPSLLAHPDGTVSVTSHPGVNAELRVGVVEPGKSVDKKHYAAKGLVEKVDFMAQIPYLVKKVIAAVAGARPYIYTWMNPATAKIEVPAALLGEEGAAGTKTVNVQGYLFSEATFISD
jgi:hypothetical protein